MRRNAMFEWMEISTAVTALGVESVGVIGLRFAGAATGGPKVANELWLMCSEKVVALAELQGRLLTGALGDTPSTATKAILEHYRRKVAANRRRLKRMATGVEKLR